MVRNKSAPTKSRNGYESWSCTDMHFRPRLKRNMLKRTRNGLFTVPLPNSSNEKYYLGSLWLGNTNNIVPEKYGTCRVRFVEEGECLEVNLDETTVAVRITNDTEFIKEFFKSKIFAVIFTTVDDKVFIQVYLLALPLRKFTTKIGKLLKTVFSLLCNVKCQEVNVEERLTGTDDVLKLYTEIHKFRTDVSHFETNVKQERLKPKLRTYQNHAVKWMLHRERESYLETKILHPLFEKVVLTTDTEVYINMFTGFVEPDPPLVDPLRTGGILADEMGLGKTVEVLACVLSNPKPVGVVEEPELKVEAAPTVMKQPRKRKFGADQDYTVDQLKRVKMSSNYWEIGELPDRIQCVCGGATEEDVVRCRLCGKLQHGRCLGFEKSFGEYLCPQCWITQPLLDCKATLIVCPTTLRKQWLDEICKHVQGDLRIFNYEGSSVIPIYPTELKNYDLVLTTYNILQSDLRLSTSIQPVTLRRLPKYAVPGSPISRINWWRLCLDEAQTVETSLMVSEMAKKLVAHHRWAVTGTPISTDLSDLHCLIDYLQFSPYSDQETWNYHLYYPYLSGHTEPLCKFMATILWRTTKNAVLEQIGIPSQTVEEHYVEFSAVEKYFYKREHELCSADFLEKLRKFDLNIPLKKLDKSSIKKILAPLLSLRQACTHPNAVRGRYLATKKEVSSMEDLLEALILKNSSEGEESLRLVVSALNGQAGIYLLVQQPENAVDKYRKVLQLAARFGGEQPEAKLKIDKLQLIHTMHNLAEVLMTNPPVQPTLRDDRLRDDCAELERKYMEKFACQTVSSLEEQETMTKKVSEIQEKFNYAQDKWYSDLLDWASSNDLFADLITRLQSVHESYNVNKMMNFPTKHKLLYTVATWDDEVFELREKTVKQIGSLYRLHDSSLSTCQKVVRAAADCHLRPPKSAKKNARKCAVCVGNNLLQQYEYKLFSQVKRDEEERSNKGAWKPSHQELVLRALVQLAKAKNADADLVHDGKTHLVLMEALKKEFKEVRKLWTFLDQQVCAKDELDVCKIRLQLKEPSGDGAVKKLTRMDLILRQLSNIQENKLETIHMLEEHELDFHRAILAGEEQENMSKLEKCVGTFSYLETLRKQQYAGQSPDPCPICHNTLNDHWSILPCGHCYCLECIERLLSQGVREHVTCAICRKRDKIAEISYIKIGEVCSDEEDVKVTGNFSTKIEAIVRLVLKLRKEDENVKVLVFSTWPSILRFLHIALQMNSVRSEVMKQQTVENTITKFKDELKNITVLLLPIQLGSKGINLIEATHVVLVEPLLNPGDESQAVGRVHRIGQTKTTVVHKFVVKNTIEDSIYKAISSNADNFDKNKITLEQLKKLFTDMPQEVVGEVVQMDV